ncbi:MAG: response regulator [Bacteroidales bacterium]|nr:response regulator [Bacteroidales bacterium]
MTGKPTSDYQWPGKKILIVEDDPASCHLFNILLKSRGSELVITDNGLDAVQICQEDSGINLVLMDIQLPIMDGYTATAKIKEMRAELPVIAQTAYALEEDEQKCYAAGCDGYLTKPVKSVELFKLIDQLI